MSANNYITINKKFEVEMRDAEEGELLHVIGQGETLEQALEIAMDNMEDVEYGLRAISKVEK